MPRTPSHQLESISILLLNASGAKQQAAELQAMLATTSEVTIQLAAADSDSEEKRYNVILLSPAPQQDILSLIAHIVALQQRAPDSAIIIVAAEANESAAIACLQAGAQDYLAMSELMNGQSLERSVRFAYERQRLRRETTQALERELVSSEERFQRIISKSMDGIVVVNRHNEVLFLNPAAEHLFGRHAAQMLNKPLNIPIHAHDATGADITLQLESGEKIVVELRAVTTSWHGEEGILIVLRDITDRKKAEEALRQFAADLQMRNEELDAFAHTVAHDLKTPIAVMIGFAETMQEVNQEMPPAEKKQLLASMVRSGKTAERIIDELLLLASVRQEDVQVRPLSMGGIVSEVLERLHHLTQQHGAEVLLPQQWPTALGYAPWIEEVWANYISNAIKYGGRPPLVELGADYGTGDDIRFWVADNGRGISAAAAESLFHPFTRLNKIEASGYGLGLSIVQRIVQRLGGKVGVQTEIGEGSIFYFTLPGAD